MESSGPRDANPNGRSLLSRPRPVMLNLPPRSFAAMTEVSPSPMTAAMARFFADQDAETDGKSLSQLLAGAMATSPAAASLDAPSSNALNQAENTVKDRCRGRGGGGSSFAERLAARFRGLGEGGGGSPEGTLRPNIARFKTVPPSRLPIPSSPYLTIPPGMSPTALLDSPVLLAPQAEPSPTTGTFPLPPVAQENALGSMSLLDFPKERGLEQDDCSGSLFKPYSKSNRPALSPLSNMAGYGFSHQQALAQIQQSHALGLGGLDPLTVPPKVETPQESKAIPSEMEVQTVTDAVEDSRPLPQPVAISSAMERPSDDGFNWRKYGQKQVKGAEFPRSYYKCTHPNCPVKKKVERSLEGTITEIIYKGEHNHQKPQSTRRNSGGASHLNEAARRANSNSITGQSVAKVDGISQTNTNGQNSDPSCPMMGQIVSYVGGTTPEQSLGSASENFGEDMEDSRAEDGDEDSDSKRRRTDKLGDSSSIVPLRTIREPRVVVQTTSDVDILDDGYRWRKYGQKVVKGNPHPRSYYKCTNVGCMVRKHVERSSTDPKAVITTYEGKHNHDVPAARRSNHDTQLTSRRIPPPPPQPGTLMPNTDTMKPFPSLQDRYLYGKLLDDGMNEDRKSADSDGSGRRGGGGGGETACEHKNRDEEGSMRVVAAGGSSIFPGGSVGWNGSEPLLGQSMVFRPKVEQYDGHNAPLSFLQTTISSGPPSLHQSILPRAILGP